MKSIAEVFAKYKFKTLKKAYKYFDNKDYGFTHKEIKEYFDSIHTQSYLKKFNKHEMGAFFSTTPGAYQMDIYFHNKQSYLLCIEINSRYVWIKRIKSKNTEDVLDAIKQFVYECNPSIITCDEESAFRSISVVDFLRSENIRLFVSLAQLHTELGVINRFCRTLNSLTADGTTVPAKRKSIKDRVENAVKIYNKTPHEATGTTPKRMHNDAELERQYIFKMMEERDEKKKLLLKNPIRKGDNVRYVLDKQMFKKNQHNRKLSRHYYKVEDVLSPFTYVIIAKDGSIKKLPRYRLYKINSKKGLTFGDSIEDESLFTVYDKIFNYYPNSNPRKSEYEVQVINRDDDGTKHKSKRRIKCYMLREGSPTHLSELEMEFFAKHKDKYQFNDVTNQFDLKK